MVPKSRRWIVGITIAGNFFPNLLMLMSGRVGQSRVAPTLVKFTLFTTRCKTIDRFSRKQDKTSLFIPRRVNKDFECRIGAEINLEVDG